ncbi:LacI family transcriptional regulator [Bordetella tumbae]|uniref:Bug family tripartite tricarboxylate transporter substrate binding protein n=1 Tax=Bordetella tumbae TaxID=1649139 RepID=UPI0039EE493C
MKPITILRGLFPALFLLGCSMSASAADYPERPIRMIAPFAPGGGSDVVARLVAEKMGPLLGQNVVVENRPGASSIIGTDLVAKASPDGYTILMTNSAITSNPSLYQTLPYDTRKDLIPVTYLADAPTLLAAHPSVPFNTVPELVAYAKQHPNEVTVGTPGAGQMSHLVAEMVSQASDTKLTMVHYKGTANSINDLVGGTIMMSFGTVPGFINFIESKKLKPVAVASRERISVLPNVPTIAETYPGFEMSVWFGVFVPAGTPDAIVDKLNTAMLQALKDPTIQARFPEEGLRPGNLSHEQFNALFRSDLDKWQTFIRERNIHLNK